MSVQIEPSAAKDSKAPSPEELRRLPATGITFLFAIPFTPLINITLSKMIEVPAIDIWDILSGFILLTIAVTFMIGDYARQKGYAK